MLRQILTLVGKDFLLEWRGRSRLLSVLLFGIITLVLFSFALEADREVLAKSTSGFVVLALLLSSTLALAESFRLEQEQRALEGLLLLPADPIAVYYGKALGNTMFLFLLAPVLVPVALVLYSVELSWGGAAAVFGVWALSAAGLSAPGTLYAAMTSRLQSQDVILPLVLFPLVIPVLLTSVKALGLIVNGDPMEQIRDWVLFLLAFNAIYWSLGGLLFPHAMEEGL